MSLLGQRLRQERESRGLALLQVELDTRIRGNLIQALENGELESLPPEPFLRGLIRIYANYLRVDPQEMLELYTADTVPTPPPPTNTRVQRPAPAPYNRAKRPASAPPAQPTPPPAEPAQPPAAKPTPEPQPPLPTERITKKSPLPASLPEPFQAIRRRLPLAPPSAKPPKPVLKVPKAAPPPSIPPEILPPVEFLPPKIVPIPPAPAAEKDAPKTKAEPILEKPKDPVQPSGKSSAIKKLPKPLQRIPVPALLAIGVLILMLIVGTAAYALVQASPSIPTLLGLQPTATPTRIPRTATPTLPAGTQPTLIPTLAATAPPFTAVAGVPNPTPTVKATPRLTSAAPGTMNLDITATQPITVQIGIDGAMVFNGPMAPGTARTWTAKQSVYLRIQNVVGVTGSMNNIKLVPMNFNERSLYERQWIIGANGKPVATTPKAPSATAPIPVNSGPAPTTAAPTSTPTTSAPPTTAPTTPAPTTVAPPTSTPEETPTSAPPTEEPTTTPEATPTPSVSPGPTATKTPFS